MVQDIRKRRELPRRVLESSLTEHLSKEHYLNKIVDMRYRHVHIDQIKAFLPGSICVLLAGSLPDLRLGYTLYTQTFFISRFMEKTAAYVSDSQ